MDITKCHANRFQRMYVSMPSHVFVPRRGIIFHTSTLTAHIILEAELCDDLVMSCRSPTKMLALR